MTNDQDLAFQPVHALAAAMAAGPSNSSDSANSGSGAARLPQITSANRSAAPACLPIRLAAAHAIAAPSTMASGSTDVPPIHLAAMIAMPPAASTAPAICQRLGRSPNASQTSPTVKKAWSWIRSEARPAGIPISIALMSRPNCTTPSMTPKATTTPTGAAGGGMKNAAGRAANRKRSAVSSKGGMCATPTLIATNASPRARTASRARRTSRIGMEGDPEGAHAGKGPPAGDL